MIENATPIIPFLTVLFVTVLSGQVQKGLLIGIVAGIWLLSAGSLYTFFQLFFSQINDQIANKDSWFLYLFLIALPSLIELFLKTGSAQAFAQRMTRKIKTKRGIELAAVASSFCLSIDDYLSILTTGQVLRSLTDTVGIPRVKLAYLIHALSGTVVILMPLSSWVATLTSYLTASGIGKNDIIASDPFTVYLYSIPHTMYSILTIMTVLFIVLKRISFGPIKQAEKAETPQQIFHKNKPVSHAAKTVHLFGPLLLLIGLIVCLILFQNDAAVFGGSRSIFQAFKHNTDIFFILAIASSTTFVLTSLYFWQTGMLSAFDCLHAIKNSVGLMYNVLFMIFLLSIFSHLARNDLKTGAFLATIAQTYVSTGLMPLIFFLTSLAIAFSTGTSWGTFGLLLPIGIPMLLKLHNIETEVESSQIPLLYQTIGAIFSGALCGDHLSLFSETTAMSAAAAQVTPEQHFKTQLAYAVPTVFGCVIYFASVGFFAHTWHSLIYPLCFGLSATATFGLLMFLKKRL